MMRGKSPPSEIILEKIKSNNSLVFEDNLEREIIFFINSRIYIKNETFMYVCLYVCLYVSREIPHVQR